MALMAIGSGFGAVLALGLTSLMLYFYVDYSSRTSAYDRSAVCASSNDIGGCRYQGPAQVVSKRTDGSALVVKLSVAGMGGRTFDAYLNKEQLATWQGWEVGSAVNAEVWQGDVSVVDGVKTVANPDELPNSAGLLPTIIFGIPALLLAGWAGYSTWLYRRIAAALSKASASSEPDERLPLTPAMKASVDDRRALEEGVFMRHHGPFAIILYTSRYADKKVAVVVNSRPLSPMIAESLESITSGNGTVDYLPSSKTVLEVRDESGRVLWSSLEKISVWD